MLVTKNSSLNSWPSFSYSDFAATQHLLHMCLQVVGKLKLNEPFQSQWAELPLWLSARGLTTGPIAYGDGAYEIHVDLLSHAVECVTSWDSAGQIPLRSMSVAQFTEQFFDLLRKAGIEVSINLKPQEVPNTIPFDQDKEQRPYESSLVTDWWRILLSTQRVMKIFQGRFKGKTQPIGLMWGTLDIRDVRYNGKPASAGAKADYIRRNAMNEELVEVGWWSGSAAYPKPAFYSFTYPQPAEIENVSVSPSKARWDASMGEFLLDYDDLRSSADPDGDLLAFFETTYRAGAERAGWDSNLVGTGTPK